MPSGNGVDAPLLVRLLVTLSLPFGGCACVTFPIGRLFGFGRDQLHVRADARHVVRLAGVNLPRASMVPG
jgi:hypothetical protein